MMMWFCGKGFTSSWGRSQDKYTQLWIVLGFEVRVLHHHGEDLKINIHSYG
jgi:hypothetical protein